MLSRKPQIDFYIRSTLNNKSYTIILSVNFHRITIKELKSFLSRVNCKITTQKLLEYFNEIDEKSRGELKFDDFGRLYQKLFHQTGVSLIQ